MRRLALALALLLWGSVGMAQTTDTRDDLGQKHRSSQICDSKNSRFSLGATAPEFGKTAPRFVLASTAGAAEVNRVSTTQQLPTCLGDPWDCGICESGPEGPFQLCCRVNYFPACDGNTGECVCDWDYTGECEVRSCNREYRPSEPQK